MVLTRRTERATSLLDIMAALALLGGGVFLALAFFDAEVRETRAQQERLAALLLAESEIERLHAVAYRDLPVGASQPIPMTLPAAQRLKGSAGTLAVEEIAPGLARVTACVTWESPRGKPLRVELTDVLSQEGLMP